MRYTALESFLGSRKPPATVLLLVLLWHAAPAPAAEPLKRYFPAPQVDELRDYRKDFAAAATVDDVAELYRRALALEKLLLAPIREEHQGENWGLLDRFKDAELDLPGLAPSCAAECTEPAFGLTVADFAAAAAKTPGEDDDAFFRLLGEFYPYVQVFDGELVGWPAYFEQTWDYGGYSLLGEGEHLACLLQIDALATGHKFFARKVGELRDLVLADLFEGSDCSGLPVADILTEIGEILRQARLSQDEAERLARRRRAFQEPIRRGIEVDCRRPVCSCGRG